MNNYGDPLSPSRLLAGGLSALGRHIDWLLQSPEGNRVVSFTVFVLVIVGMIALFRAAVVRRYGSAAFGWGQVALGLALLCFAGDSWHLGHIGILAALAIGFVGLMLMSGGSDNIRKDQGATAAPPKKDLRIELPPQTVYGKAQPASPREIDEALRDRASLPPGSYRYED